MGLAGRLGAAFFLMGAVAWSQPPRSRSANIPVTFSNQIVRIFQQHCLVCHHPGDIGPFSLLSYPEAAFRAASIKAQTQARQMPPWKPVAGHGEFLNERRLPQRQIDLIARWVDEGAPEGDPSQLPPPLVFADEWRLGPPDLVIEPQSDFTVPAQGGDVYRCFSLPSGLLQSRQVKAVEVRPANRSVVHHVLLFQDALGISALMGQAGDPQPGYPCFGGPGFLPTGILGGWVPGNLPQTLPEGVGISTPAGVRVVMQVHYHPNGVPQSDRTRIGLYFARETIRKELLILPLLNTSFVIPPGASSHTVTASLVTPAFLTARLIAIVPHMHLLGRQIRVEATARNGQRRPLIFIDDWDFQWQDSYYYKDPVLVTPGTRLDVTAVYDNSSANPRNPNNPPREMRWGEQTTDEMCLVFLAYTLE